MTGVNNIVLPTSPSCPFCAFLQGEKPYTILRRDELVAILVTREQRGLSHLLVVPVRHCPTILDLRDEEAGALMCEIRHAARLVDAAERRPGIAVWQNNGISARQAVAHVHFHVAGTLEEGGTQWGEVPKLSVAETDAIAGRLRQVEASLPHPVPGQAVQVTQPHPARQSLFAQDFAKHHHPGQRGSRPGAGL